MKAIGKIYTDFPEKFGIPRQSGLVKQLEGRIILDPPYNVKEAFDGIEEYSYLWILWQFSECIKSDFSPTVRPPKLGGEKRKAYLRHAHLSGRIISVYRVLSLKMLRTQKNTVRF